MGSEELYQRALCLLDWRSYPGAATIWLQHSHPGAYRQSGWESQARDRCALDTTPSGVTEGLPIKWVRLIEEASQRWLLQALGGWWYVETCIERVLGEEILRHKPVIIAHDRENYALQALSSKRAAEVGSSDICGRGSSTPAFPLPIVWYHPITLFAFCFICGLVGASLRYPSKV